MCVCVCVRVRLTHTYTLTCTHALSLYPACHILTLSISPKQRRCRLLSQGYLLAVCVCVCVCEGRVSPLLCLRERVRVYPCGNSCPDGISSFGEACNQLFLRCSSLRPGGGEAEEEKG